MAQIPESEVIHTDCQLCIHAVKKCGEVVGCRQKPCCYEEKH